LDENREIIYKKESTLAYRQSSKLLELRQKEKTLVKLKRYKDAEKIKEAADEIEEYEREIRFSQVLFILCY
jgi:hypothetical protein